MKKSIQFYRCRHCGNIITHLEDSGVRVVCCGEEMGKLDANSTDAATEKHVPVVAKAGDDITVTVGAVEHPMIPEHFIEWIACVSDNRTEFVKLAPGEAPSATFYKVTSGTVYAYCNLHGLWKEQF